MAFKKKTEQEETVVETNISDEHDDGADKLTDAAIEHADPLHERIQSLEEQVKKLHDKVAHLEYLARTIH